MSFDTLSAEFNNVLTQYQSTYQDYINSLDSSNNTLMSMPNTFFTGQSQLNVLQGSTVDACQSSCSANSSCTGATFNTTSNVCTLSSGNGSLSKSSDTTSLVQQGIYYTYQLQQLNNQLMSINQQMMQNSNNSQSAFEKNQQKSQQAQQAIMQNYNTLAQEREEIDRMIKQYETLNEAYDNSTIMVNSQYANYIVLLLVTILLIFLLIKFSITPSSQYGGGRIFKNEAFFLLAIMIVFLGLSQIYKNYNGYIVVSIILIAYIIAKMKMNY